VWGVSSGDVFAVGTNDLYSEAVIRHYARAVWNQVIPGRSWPLTCIWGSSATDIFAAGYAGTLLHYREL